MTPQEIEALRNERDALAARIQTAERAEKIFSEMPELTFDDCLKLFAIEIRDIQAEAGRKGYAQALFDQFAGNYQALDKLKFKPDEYAELVRKGGAK